MGPAGQFWQMGAASSHFVPVASRRLFYAGNDVWAAAAWRGLSSSLGTQEKNARERPQFSPIRASPGGATAGWSALRGFYGRRGVPSGNETGHWDVAVPLLSSP